MTVLLDLAANLVDRQRNLAALSILLRETAGAAEERYVNADLLLGKLAVEDFESWAKFKRLLLSRFENAFTNSSITSARLLECWVSSVRKHGLGELTLFFLHGLQDGMLSTEDSEIKSFAGVALSLLESEGEPDLVYLESFGLANPDVFLLMKCFYEAQRPHAALPLAKIRLERCKEQGMWDHLWHARILIALGRHDEAFDAYYQFIGLALQEEDLTPVKNAVTDVLKLIPFCNQMKKQVVQLRELVAERVDFEKEFRHLELLVGDIEEFRLQAHTSQSICVGRHYYPINDLPGIEEKLERELRLRPNPKVYYELAKINALRMPSHDIESAREYLLTAIDLDAQLFDNTVCHE